MNDTDFTPEDFVKLAKSDLEQLGLPTNQLTVLTAIETYQSMLSGPGVATAFDIAGFRQSGVHAAVRRARLAQAAELACLQFAKEQA